MKVDFDNISPELITKITGEGIDEREVPIEIYINSPKLKITKTFESNYVKEEERLRYNIDITNEKENSIAKKVTLIEKITNGYIDKDSIIVKDDNEKIIPKENYDIVEENGKLILKFKEDIYIIGRNSNKKEILKKNNISDKSNKIYNRINITYDAVKEKGKDSISTSIVNRKWY